ncbi:MULTISPECIES: hypothetical protein [Microbacterium]|uniref:hypothetical protein n=1 Tax=Microbacterium TaxID=33882 RepID=UPI00278414AA|nr:MULTISPECIES: hypothetical protein [Microbacterium]MDQ1084853.1 septal ring factor EnvC (AmiA/AmiB activator) [Microbacterium sp. SORGH_AS_0344]MDQ1169867.1 septal ring factor EnvC (AmiA/AmiB activator) [Microbacterium proteolyticum]
METLPLIATAVGLVVSVSTTVLGGTKWLLHRVEQRFAQVDQRFAQVDQRFAQMDQRFAQVDQRFAQVDQQLRSVAESVTELKIAVARIEGPHPPFLIARG